jgi:hypothetical protein
VPCHSSSHFFKIQVIDKRQQEFQSALGDDALCDDGISMRMANNILSVPSFISIFYSEKRRPFLDLLLEGSANGTALSKKHCYFHQPESGGKNPLKLGTPG